MQRTRKTILRDERDEAAAGNSDELVVIHADDLAVAHGQRPDAKRPVGDGRAVLANDEKLLRVRMAGAGAAAHTREDAEARAGDTTAALRPHRARGISTPVRGGRDCPANGVTTRA